MPPLERGVLLLTPFTAIAIGIAFAAYEIPICQTCWLDAALRWLLPDSLDAMSGSLPWLGVGLVFLLLTWREQR